MQHMMGKQGTPTSDRVTSLLHPTWDNPQFVWSQSLPAEGAGRCMFVTQRLRKDTRWLSSWGHGLGLNVAGDLSCQGPAFH